MSIENKMGINHDQAKLRSIVLARKRPSDGYCPPEMLDRQALVVCVYDLGEGSIWAQTWLCMSTKYGKVVEDQQHRNMEDRQGGEKQALITG